MDVQQLQEQLDLRLQDQEAFETGICPKRRELYTQCFGKHLFLVGFCALDLKLYFSKPWYGTVRYVDFVSILPEYKL